MHGGGFGQCDDPGFRVARLVNHGDVGGDPLLGELDAGEHVLAPGETLGQDGLPAVLEDQQVLLEPQAVMVALRIGGRANGW